MAAESLVIFLLIGAVAGWLAGVIVRGYGIGLIGNIVVGVIGSLVGGWLFGRFHLIHGGGLLGDVIGATLGAVILLFLIRLVRRRTVFQRVFNRRI
ncbi:MAG TPA: GlsB/YeaQ/YmgE family stress response membrane protein [Caulobacteraceae bacterium]|nr:GlsB/YeaQ/YmgE family stress response membrane protein [Caulobacteraceae bacterium]